MLSPRHEYWMADLCNRSQSDPCQAEQLVLSVHRWEVGVDVLHSSTILWFKQGQLVPVPTEERRRIVHDCPVDASDFDGSPTVVCHVNPESAVVLGKPAQQTPLSSLPGEDI